MNVNMPSVTQGYVTLDYHTDSCGTIVGSDIIHYKHDEDTHCVNKLQKTMQNLVNSFNGIFHSRRSLCSVKKTVDSVQRRDLPPVPVQMDCHSDIYRNEKGSPDHSPLDFAASILKVKDYGWYWGPLTSSDAEKILKTEPDGSFIVRDSSDHHHIFSITFKLSGAVRHVRIEHNEGNFSFESFSLFRRKTIVEFVESAVEHSQSGRYLFFLQRRPVLGPMRVQLLHPVSRFRTVPSLQHLCRFQILKYVRKDLIDKLPLPLTLQSYLNTSYYYTEDWGHHENNSIPLTHFDGVEINVLNS